jgi:ketosteroid isomerase-like protein
LPSENVATVRRYIEEFNRRDFDCLVADADPDVELSEWPDAPGAQTYRGPDGVRQALDQWFDTWEWMRLEIEDIVEIDGDRVLFTLHQRVKGRGSGIEIEIKAFNVYSFRDGKVTRIQLFTEREPALEAAGVSPDYQEEKR